MDKPARPVPPPPGYTAAAIWLDFWVSFWWGWR